MFSILNDNLNKVKTKEELLKLLDGYRGILTNTMLDYLNSLIELEFSVMKENINDSDRKALAELEIYKKIAIYNIYNRVQNLFKQLNGEYVICGNNNGFEALRVSTAINDRKIELFDFDYKEYCNKVPNGFKSVNIGSISLFQTIENKEARETELKNVMSILERLYKARNPFPPQFGVLGGPRPEWELDHARKIYEYEERFKKLDSKKELSEEDKREIEITRQVHDLLLEDFGLTKESFIDENSLSFADFGREETEMERKLVRRMPNLTITDNIKYI